MPHYFTLQEANETLKVIMPLMDEIHSIRQMILEKQPEIWPKVQKSAGNGGSAQLSRLHINFDRFDKLVHQIMDLGGEIKDIDSGLMDFLALRNGHEVYLCWRMGEPEIQYWHEIEEGFAGRQPINTF